MASTIYVEDSQIDIEYCNITLNTAIVKGTIYALTNPQVTIRNSVITKNLAMGDSAVLFANNIPLHNITFVNTSITENTASSNSFSFLFASGVFQNCTLYKNKATSVNNGATLFNSKVYLLDTNVTCSNDTDVTAITNTVDTGFFQLDY